MRSYKCLHNPTDVLESLYRKGVHYDLYLLLDSLIPVDFIVKESIDVPSRRLKPRINTFVETVDGRTFFLKKLGRLLSSTVGLQVLTYSPVESECLIT